MKQDLKPKIGFSQLGGIYIANNIKSDFHQHHLIAIILSFDNSFEIRLQNSQTTTHKAVLIQKDLNYSLKTDESSHTVFIHIDPYTEIGINLSQQNELIQNLDITNFSDVLLDLKNWFIETENKTENKTERTEILLKKITDIIINEYP